jgi:acyl carrier protein
MENVDDIYTLSPTQKGILFHTLTSPEAGDLYLVQVVAELSSGDPELFRQACQLVFERHPMLRTAFHWEDLDDPLQIVMSEAPLPMAGLDWRTLSAAEQDVRFTDFLSHDRERGLDLSQAPLARLTLIRLSENEIRVVFTIHTLLVDGWSKGIVLKEINEVFAALLNGETPAPGKVVPFKNYIGWLQNEPAAATRQFWTQKLNGYTAPLTLNGMSQNATGPIGYDDVIIELDEAITLQINTFLRRHRLTLTTLVQAVWALLLSKYGDTDDVVFGTTVSGRPSSLEGAESIVGFLINTIPVRIKVDREADLLQWMQAQQEDQNEIRNHENVPFPVIRQWSEIPAANPLFDSVVLVQNWPDVGVLSRFRQLRFFPLPRTMYPVTLGVFPRDGRILLYIAYRRRCLIKNQAGQILQQFESLLQRVAGMMAGSGQSVSATTRGMENLLPVAASPRATEEPGPALRRTLVAPVTPVQRDLVQLCSELLGQETISIDDNFFLLGGHSLLAAQLVARIRHQFELEIPIGKIFELPTVEQLAEHIEGMRFLSKDFEVNTESCADEREEIQI